MNDTVTLPRALAPVGPNGKEAELLTSRPEMRPAIGSTAAVLDMIVRAATDPAVDVDKMERLMAMHDKIVLRQAETDFNAAMKEVQSEMRHVAADASNPQTRSKYASYPALDSALRPLYTKHGFSLSFDSGDGAPEGCVRVLCYCGHTGGYTRTYRADMPSDGKGAKGGDVMTKTHAAGSAFTYGQRYLLKLIFNVAVGEDDDDGNAAGSPTITAEQKDEIIVLLKETNSDVKGFLKYMKAESVDTIPAKEFKNAIAALNKKKGVTK